jgi:hypothetical protein
VNYRIDIAPGPPLTLAIMPLGFSGGDIQELCFETIDSLVRYLREIMRLPDDAISRVRGSLGPGISYAEAMPLDTASVGQFRKDVEAQLAS